MATSRFTTNAEKQADTVRDLPSFRNFSLPGVRDKVEDLLKLIGRGSSFFSTYTLHDITHIDSMLGIANWIIPEVTQEKMTSTDWLMIVLSTYFHDMGMIVTKEEFELRKDNPEFLTFIKGIQEDPQGQDYLFRIKKLEEKELAEFYYQEFVRKTHAERVRDWIRGKDKYYWGEQLKALVCEIQKTLDGLPKRFRDDLALVCESHHKNDLNKTDKYPLYRYYGGDARESTNIQYAAIILRTIDLLHVTKDRTPSVMFKTLQISDPLGIMEWEKQLGTFSVNKIGRALDLEDTDTHIVVISADFEEERPYFSLSEYITYANKQISQSKSWIDDSQNENDGKGYLFPWRAVKGSITVGGHKPIPIKFELDRGKLLDLLVGHTLYNDPTVVIRELIQNAIDAVRFKFYLEKKKNTNAKLGQVKVYWDTKTRRLTVKDSGIGMDKNVIDNNLMKVGASFYNSEEFKLENKDFSPISRFGIGVLTCFMVSDDIEIITIKKEEGYRIRMTSVHAEYLLKKIDKGDKLLEHIEPNGTKVNIEFRPTVTLRNRTILDILKYWIIIPACDVLYYEDNKFKEKIGFSSVEEVLKVNQVDELEKKSVSDYFKHEIEIKTAKKIVDDSTYKIAYAVKKSYTPEKGFVRFNNVTARVSVEGIRVDRKLPGFSEHGICAFLSVEGNKGFRTNVSRDSLEKDKEYFNVSKICLDFFKDHITEELQRISTKEGNPLSQAATATNWLTSGVLNTIIEKNTKEYFNEYLKGLNSMVLEKLETQNGKLNVKRELISQKMLLNLNEIWTIDSRLERNLGIISRDLSTELSLNEFLNTFDSSLIKLDATPILIDHKKNIKFLLENYYKPEVVPSVSSKQVSIKWKINKDKEGHFHDYLDNLFSKREYTEIFSDLCQFYNLDEKFYAWRSDYRFVGEGLSHKSKYVVISKLEKETIKRNINGVLTEDLVLISDKSYLSEVLSTLITLFKILLANDRTKDFCFIALTYCVFLGYLNDVIAGGPYGNAFPNRLDVYKHSWNYILNDLNELLEKNNYEIIKENDFIEIVKNKEDWFILSRYWFDWNR